MERNVVGWFELPVSNMERAMKFYGTLGFSLERHKVGPLDMAWFPMHEKAAGAAGSLVKHEQYTPSDAGVLIYFTTPSGDLDKDCASVTKAGGTVLLPKKKISDNYGFMALIKDTEGNRVALHSRT